MHPERNGERRESKGCGGNGRGGGAEIGGGGGGRRNTKESHFFLKQQEVPFSLLKPCFVFIFKHKLFLFKQNIWIKNTSALFSYNSVHVEHFKLMRLL